LPTSRPVSVCCESDRSQGIPRTRKSDSVVSDGSNCGGSRWRRDTPRTSGYERSSLSSPARALVRRRAFSTLASRRPSDGWIDGGRPAASRPSLAPVIAARHWSNTSNGSRQHAGTRRAAGLSRPGSPGRVCGRPLRDEG
jgi:hypothetical protein